MKTKEDQPIDGYARLFEYLKKIESPFRRPLPKEPIPLDPQEAARIRAFVEEVYEKLMKRDEEKGTGEHS